MTEATIHPSAWVDDAAVIGEGVSIGAFCVIHAGVELRPGTTVGSHCILGETGRPGGAATQPTVIGEGSLLRSGTIVYAGVATGEKFETGHRATIRENTQIGHHVRIGTLSDIQGDCSFGDYCRLHSNVHVGKGTRVADFVWLYPYVVITNDPHPPSDVVQGVTVERFAVIATSSVILPGVTIGSGSLVSAMSLVRSHVRAGMVVAGNPAEEVCEVTRIRDRRDRRQSAYPWRYHFERGMPWEGIGYDAWAAEHDKNAGQG